MVASVRALVVVATVVVLACLFPTVVTKSVTRLCTTKPIVTVNGKFPGPTLYAREDDNVIVEVINNVQYNVTIHWHGIKQVRTGWADGPAYITQCPIPPGQSYVYNFTITKQRGTLLWHAHVLWLRATVHGAIVVLPKLNVPYPFQAPDKEVVIILDGSYLLRVLTGQKYLLRIINAALNEELFFRISGHRLTVVEADAIYTKPFETDTILVGPGQTTNAILSADRPAGRYMITASTFLDTPIAVDNVTATAILHYTGSLSTDAVTFSNPPPVNATAVASSFIDSLRSMNSPEYPATVPETVDHSLLFVVGMGVNPCNACSSGIKVVADINNVSFVLPSVALLQAHYYNVSGVFTDDFPGRPPTRFDYTGNNTAAALGTTTGTKVYRVKYNETVQVVLQGTTFIAPENHPFHLHGFNFFAVARGIGNYDPEESPETFNLVDPIERNTAAVPSGGWIAIRFRADNPGVWFMHCHLEVHTTWGLKMAFLVENGEDPDQSLMPPPNDLPTC
ncbi:Laccase-22 [Acorus calamus]|uniref:Laccase-22 n=1 Tax=Acorus calamus TaxID=4465 RepID=A0AAV9FC46_ACOCL|nr:Laccase-22 [Acorus calamus]